MSYVETPAIDLDFVLHFRGMGIDPGQGVSTVSGKNGPFWRCTPEWVQVSVELVPSGQSLILCIAGFVHS